jgi:hypothetical protein
MKIGLVSKEDFAAALRAHQAAIDATKSPQRKAVAEFERMRDSRRIKVMVNREYQRG